MGYTCYRRYANDTFVSFQRYHISGTCNYKAGAHEIHWAVIARDKFTTRELVNTSAMGKYETYQIKLHQ